jgi:hypothetical protein
MATEWGSEIEGSTLYYFFGNRVVKSTASGGRVVAVKVKPRRSFARSEAKMMEYASASRY